MANDPYFALIDKVLYDSDANLWESCWRKIVHGHCVSKACDSIDLVNVQFAPSFQRLDDPRFRIRVIPSGRQIWDECNDAIAAYKKDFTSAFKQAGLRPIGKGVLKEKLDVEAPVRLRNAISQRVIKENPFPTIWRDVANELARQFYAKNYPVENEEEWALLNQLTSIGYFWGCLAPEARIAQRTLERANDTLLGLRGSFIRFPKHISSDGVKDQVPPISSRTGSYSPKHKGLSDLLSSIDEISGDVASGFGFVGNCFREQFPGMDQRKVAQYKRRCNMLENSVLSYLGVISIEQLLRSAAERHGLQHMHGTKTIGITKWLNQLGLSAVSEQKVLQLFDPDRLNLRNLIVHGNILDVGSKWLEVLLPINQPSKYDIHYSDDDPYLPRNTCRLVLDCLEAVDVDLHSLDLNTADLKWASDLMIPLEDIKWARQFSNELFSTDYERWVRLTTDYPTALMPSLTQLIIVGNMAAWGDQEVSTLPRFLPLVIQFEITFRLTCHLFGFEILQRPFKSKNQRLRFQTRMLDRSSQGLCLPEMIDKFVEHVEPEGRANAKKMLALGVQVRDAFAHGAIIQLPEYDRKGIGQILFKSTQLLMVSGLRYMIENAAFFNWKNNHNSEHGFDINDWELAQRQIHELVQRYNAETLVRKHREKNMNAH